MSLPRDGAEPLISEPLELPEVALDDEALLLPPLDEGELLLGPLEEAALLLPALEDGSDEDGSDDDGPEDDPDDEPLLLQLDEPEDEALDELLRFDELEQHSQQQQPAW